MTQVARADDSRALSEALESLRRGDPVALPTETVYGLAGRIDQQASIDSIFRIKGRPKHDPLIVHVPVTQRSFEDLVQSGLTTRSSPHFDHRVEQHFNALTEAFWPGPLTLVVPKGANVLSDVTSGGDTVALRSPDHPIFQRFLQELGVPLAAPSANRFGRISPTSCAHVLDELQGRISWVVDGGPCVVGIESTVVRLLLNGRAKILRPGLYGAEDLQARVSTLEFEHSSAASSGPLASPGLLDSHYAPSKPVVALEQLRSDVVKPSRSIALLSWSADTLSKDRNHLTQMGATPLVSLALTDRGDFYEAARSWYHLLRELDQSDVDLIVVGPFPGSQKSVVQALRDRLRRASAARS